MHGGWIEERSYFSRSNPPERVFPNVSFAQFLQLPADGNPTVIHKVQPKVENFQARVGTRLVKAQQPEHKSSLRSHVKIVA